MRRIIMTGASGFLGSEIIRESLKTEDIDVVAVTSKSEKIKEIAGDQCVIISTEDFLKNGFLFKENDVFVNCLFPTNADGRRMADGLEKVFAIITIARENGVEAFMNISSQSVYASQRTQPAREGDSLSLETAYDVGKYSSELFCNQVFKGVPHTNIRLASLLGIGYNQRIINRIVDYALKGNELEVVGGMQRYGFLDVRDAANGIVKMTKAEPKAWKETYNLGHQKSYTLIEVVECIVSELKKRGIMTGYVVHEGTDTRNSSIDASLFMEDFIWQPAHSLTQMTGDIIDSKLYGMEK